MGEKQGGARWNAEESARFINPYAFVPVTGQTPQRVAVTFGTLSGYLDCEIRLQTPLIVPDAEGKTGSPEHWTYRFFRVGDTPMIPGSSLRGTIRSAYEAITDSCLSTVPDTVIGLRTHDFNASAGLLMKDGNEYVLYAADSICIDSGICRDISNGKPKPKGLKVYEKLKHRLRDPSNGKWYDNFSAITVDWFGNRIPRRWVGTTQDTERYPCSQENVQGYLLMIPKGHSTKRYDYVMAQKQGQVPITREKADSVIVRLTHQLAAYRDNVGEKTPEGEAYDQLRTMLQTQEPSVIPIWYHKGAKGYYYSFAQNGRKECYTTLHQVLGAYRPCKNATTDGVCPACRLFGYAGTDAAVSGRVRFSDAVTKPFQGAFRTLAPLSSPKISATEFYLTQPKSCDAWDYDTPNVQIRGRKFYWQHAPGTASCAKTKLNATFELMEQGTFTCRVYFDRISQAELDTLKWAICLGENRTDSKRCLMFGHGKPLGYGSAKMTIVQEIIRTFSGDGYEMRTQTDVAVPPLADEMAENIRALCRICTQDATAGHTVCYPLGEDVTERDSGKRTSVFQWFLGNRAGKDGLAKPQKPAIRLTLPSALEQDVTLPKLMKDYRSANVTVTRETPRRQTGNPFICKQCHLTFYSEQAQANYCPTCLEQFPVKECANPNCKKKKKFRQTDPKQIYCSDCRKKMG